MLSVVVVVGVALLVSRQVFNYSGLAFDFLTYILSIAAIALAILSVSYNIQQGRILRRMVREVHEAIAELKEVSDSNDKIEREIDEEFHMNKAITDVLAEYGVGDNEQMRRRIARKASRRLKKTLRHK